MTAPTYIDMMDNYKKNKLERMQFFFCNDNIEKCMKRTKQKWVVSRPVVLEVWPIKMGTKYSFKEILVFKNVDFQLSPHVEMSFRKLF